MKHGAGISVLSRRLRCRASEPSYRAAAWRFTVSAYLPDGDRYVVAAANAGAPASPAWYRNLVANPGVTVEVGTETFGGIAAVAAGAERRILYERCAIAYLRLARYQAMTTREIPIVVIARQRDDQAARDRG